MRLSLLLALSLATTATANPRLAALRAKLAAKAGPEAAWVGPEEPGRIRVSRACADHVGAVGAAKTTKLSGNYPLLSFGPGPQTTLLCPDAGAWTTAVAGMAAPWTFLEVRGEAAHKVEFARFDGPGGDGDDWGHKWAGFTGFTEADRAGRKYRIGVKLELYSSGPTYRWLPGKGRGMFQEHFYGALPSFEEGAPIHGGPFVKTRVAVDGAEGAYYGQVQAGRPQGYGFVVVPERFAYAGWLVDGYPQGWGVLLSLAPPTEGVATRQWVGAFDRGTLPQGAEAFEVLGPDSKKIGEVAYVGEMHDGEWEGEGEVLAYFAKSFPGRWVHREKGTFRGGRLAQGTRTYRQGEAKTEVAVKDGRDVGGGTTKVHASTLQEGDLFLRNGFVTMVVKQDWDKQRFFHLSDNQKYFYRHDEFVELVGRDHPGAARALAGGAVTRQELQRRADAEEAAWRARTTTVRAIPGGNFRAISFWATRQGGGGQWQAYAQRKLIEAKLGY